jgi:hypothetical protein
MSLNTGTTTEATYSIVPLVNGRFGIEYGGNLLRNNDGNVREFNTRNSARKRIARERSGNFHA